VTPATLPVVASQELKLWGRVIYVIGYSAEEITVARDWAVNNAPPMTFVVIPSEPMPVLETALEVEALTALKRDPTLVSIDPLIEKELDELCAVARYHLSKVMHRLTTERPSAAVWYLDGQPQAINSERPAGITASGRMNHWFRLTPQIRNDQVVRQRLSRQMQTASVRVVMRLMERAQDALLGYVEGDSSAEASVYRTVLANTGIHLSTGKVGSFAQPEDLLDPGMAKVWHIVREYFTHPGIRPLTALVSDLVNPPIGLASGVMPILVMAGYKAYARVVAIKTDGEFVHDVLGFDATRMFLEPARHVIEVFSPQSGIADYLSDVAYIFAHRRPGEYTELIRFANDALKEWKSGIAEGARRSQRLSDDARLFLDVLTDSLDPSHLLLNELPQLFGGPNGNLNSRLSATIQNLEQIRNLIDRLVDGYLRDAVDALGEVLRIDRSRSVIGGIQSWISCFDVSGLLARDDMKLTDKAILRTLMDTTNGRSSPETLARAVSSILLQRGIEQWQDGTRDHFIVTLRECRQRIENIAIEVPFSNHQLVPILESRIAELRAKLQSVKQNRSYSQGVKHEQ
jgi:hypothetical protein